MLHIIIVVKIYSFIATDGPGGPQFYTPAEDVHSWYSTHYIRFIFRMLWAIRDSLIFFLHSSRVSFSPARSFSAVRFRIFNRMDKFGLFTLRPDERSSARSSHHTIAPSTHHQSLYHVDRRH